MFSYQKFFFWSVYIFVVGRLLLECNLINIWVESQFLCFNLLQLFLKEIHI